MLDPLGDRHHQFVHPGHPGTGAARVLLGAPPGASESRPASFYEDSTFWNPSWTITHGAVQTTTIHDLEATAAGLGSGRLLSRESYQRMVLPELRGPDPRQPGCATQAHRPTSTPMVCVVLSGDWLLQNPMFGGYAAIEAYLPAEKIAIAVAVTFAQDAFGRKPVTTANRPTPVPGGMARSWRPATRHRCRPREIIRPL